jgi:hypothetical protein
MKRTTARSDTSLNARWATFELTCCRADWMCRPDAGELSFPILPWGRGIKLGEVAQEPALWSEFTPAVSSATFLRRQHLEVNGQRKPQTRRLRIPRLFADIAFPSVSRNTASAAASAKPLEDGRSATALNPPARPSPLGSPGSEENSSPEHCYWTHSFGQRGSHHNRGDFLLAISTLMYPLRTRVAAITASRKLNWLLIL